MATYVHGKGAKFSMDVGTTPTLTDISDIITEATISINLDMADTSHFGSNSKTYITGQNDATSSVTGLFDRARLLSLTQAMSKLMDGTVTSLTVEMGPEGGATGATKLSQEMVISSLEIGASIGETVSVSFELQRTGDTTFGVY